MIIDNKKKKIIITIVLIILLFLITILIVKIQQKKKRQDLIEQEIQRVKQYTAITDFQTLEEVALYLNCTLIKSEESKREDVSTDVYMKLPNDVTSNIDNNRNFIENLIQYCASVLKYKSFIIIDQKNNLTILVYCQENEQVVEKYYINDIENYFDIKQNQNNLDNLETINPITINVTSNELSQIISNNWKLDNLNLGTVESIYRKYDIYFDEGFEVRKVAGKVFNIVFNEKYQNNVVNDLNVRSNKQEIEKSLGKPQFESGNLIGYKSENIYVFFYKNQISIYRVEKYDTEKIAEIIENYQTNGDINNLVNQIKQVWKDYDFYEYDKDYANLKYSLKGLSVKYDSTTKKGIIIYNNYSGKILRKY